MQIFTFKQYSDEYWQTRAGLPTASEGSRIITPKTGALSAQSAGYMNKLLAERRGIFEDSHDQTEWMERGHELEDDARVLFAAATCADVREVGFIKNSDGTAGCSPDGLIFGHTDRHNLLVSEAHNKPAPVAGLEIKCPKAATHIGYQRHGKLPDKYKPQVHMSMFIAQVDTWHFMSYHPSLQPLFIAVHFDQYTMKVGAALTEFCAKLESEDKRLAA